MDKITEPAKLKAATTYNAAADHFDDGPLAFFGIDTDGKQSNGFDSSRDRSSLMSVAAAVPQPFQLPKPSDRTVASLVQIWPNGCS